MSSCFDNAVNKYLQTLLKEIKKWNNSLIFVIWCTICSSGRSTKILGRIDFRRIVFRAERPQFPLSYRKNDGLKLHPVIQTLVKFMNSKLSPLQLKRHLAICKFSRWPNINGVSSFCSLSLRLYAWEFYRVIFDKSWQRRIIRRDRERNCLIVLV